MPDFTAMPNSHIIKQAHLAYSGKRFIFHCLFCLNPFIKSVRAEVMSKGVFLLLLSDKPGSLLASMLHFNYVPLCRGASGLSHVWHNENSNMGECGRVSTDTHHKFKFTDKHSMMCPDDREAPGL